MPNATRIALVGNHDAGVVAHQAIPRALALAGEALGVHVAARWVATETIVDDDAIAAYDGVWCVPASPYRSADGALRAIRVARVRGIPFLGTCGGFQHAVLEYARHVLGWADAGHAELTPDAPRAVITPLACSLVEATGHVRLFPGTRIADAYGALETVESYHCSYGLASELRDALVTGSLRVSAEDDAGDARAIELADHPFFVGTLFQPERAALAGRTPPLVTAFLGAAVRR